MKVYIVTEEELEKLSNDLQLAAMTQANVLNERWNLVDDKHSAYNLWRGFNYVVARWKMQVMK